jgi:hypothetical protein
MCIILCSRLCSQNSSHCSKQKKGLTMDCDDDLSSVGSYVSTSEDNASALEQGAINDEKAPRIGAKEDEWVIISRLLVIAVLSISAFLTCLFLFLFMTQQENSNFESDVSILAVMLLLSTTHTVLKTVASLPIRLSRSLNSSQVLRPRSSKYPSKAKGASPLRWKRSVSWSLLRPCY